MIRLLAPSKSQVLTCSPSPWMMVPSSASASFAQRCSSQAVIHLAALCYFSYSATGTHRGLPPACVVVPLCPVPGHGAGAVGRPRIGSPRLQAVEILGTQARSWLLPRRGPATPHPVVKTATPEGIVPWGLGRPLLDTGPGGLHGQWCHSTESSGAAWKASASHGEASGRAQFANDRRSVCGAGRGLLRPLQAWCCVSSAANSRCSLMSL